MPNFILTSKSTNSNSDEILIANIDGAKCKTLKKFFINMAKELFFPEYFGKNLDSFDEMINDLTWLEQEAVIISIKNFDQLLEDEIMEDDEDCKGLILSLLDQAADDQKTIKDGVPIKLIIEPTEIVEEYLNNIGIDFIRN